MTVQKLHHHSLWRGIRNSWEQEAWRGLLLDAADINDFITSLMMFGGIFKLRLLGKKWLDEKRSFLSYKKGEAFSPSFLTKKIK